MEQRLIELGSELREGNLENFSEFYELTKRQVYYGAYAIAHDSALAEDRLQDSYVKFLENTSKLKKNTNPFGYLLVITRNTAYNLMKHRSFERTEYEDENLFIPTYDEKPSDEQKVFAKVREILTPDEYEIIILRVINELPHKQIAKIMKKPLGTVQWSYRNAIQKLEEGLKDWHEG